MEDNLYLLIVISTNHSTLNWTENRFMYQPTFCLMCVQPTTGRSELHPGEEHHAGGARLPAGPHYSTSGLTITTDKTALLFLALISSSLSSVSISSSCLTSWWMLEMSLLCWLLVFPIEKWKKIKESMRPFHSSTEQIRGKKSVCSLDF